MGVSMASRSAALVKLLAGQPVVPVLKIDRLEDAVPLARALAAGGLPAIEITLRTPVALDAIRAVAKEVPEAIVGAGTILNVRDFENVEKAGARFVVSPGQTPDLLKRAAKSDAAFLPGAITPAEMMTLLEHDYTVAKFFPAEQAGGVAFIKSLASPFAGLSFCPTGGISAKNAGEYLSQPNIVCIGGSWVAPDDALKAGDWARVTKLAAEAAALRKG
jgi:2-dehydro-3-deoxyphosphogluconate aldolase/(4S)-4-hydroxy-2-oxoglutarate aldolase